MSFWESILLGIIQGLTEFLPVSSSGHLVIFQKLLGLREHDLGFDIVAHLGTLCAVLVVYRRVVLQTAEDCFSTVIKRQMTPGAQLLIYMFVASLPTGLIGVLFKDHFENLFNSLFAVGFFLCVTGALLFATRRTSSSGGVFGTADIAALNAQLNYKKALCIGFFQGLAITPGISRSGTTIATGLFLKLDKSSAALFSFLIAIPAILGAAVLQLKDFPGTTEGVSYLITGFVSSFIFGWIGLSAVLAAVRKGRLDRFSIYLWIVGGLSMLLSVL